MVIKIGIYKNNRKTKKNYNKNKKEEKFLFDNNYY